MIKTKRGEVGAQSQMSEGWIGVVGDFFNDGNTSTRDAEKRLHDLLMQHEDGRDKPMRRQMR